MTIKQNGGIFGRNPTFNDVTIEGDLTTESGLTTSGGITTSGNIISSEQGITTPTADGITIERPTGTSSPTPVELRMSTTSSASDWSTSNPWGRVAFYNKDTSGGGGKIHASMEIRAAHTSGGRSKLAFKTTLNSGDTLADALVIDPDQGSGRHVTVSDGNLVIGTSGNGIDFSATSDASGSSSELFDDYEEGTWTPVVADAESGGNNCTMSAEPFTFGRYTKIGRLVNIEGSIRISGVSGVTTSNSAYITGLPFTPNSTGSGLKGGCVVRASYLDTPANCVNLGVAVRSTSTLTINTSIDASSSTTLTVANIQSTNANHYVSFNVSYYV